MKNKIGKNIENIFMGTVIAVGVLGFVMAQASHANTPSATKRADLPRPMQSSSCTPTPSPSPTE
jgi:hypothetical protein